ncbi:MAG: hypothetical protein AAGA56_14805 [Myxococcota bacterium]
MVQELLDELGFSPLDREREPTRYVALLRLARSLTDAKASARYGVISAGRRTVGLELALHLALLIGQTTSARVAVLEASLEPSVFAAPPFEIDVTSRVTLYPAHHPTMPHVERAIVRADAAFVLADLTGLRRRGEHRRGFDLVDGVIIAAEQKRTRERDLIELADAIPPPANLGVVLMPPPHNTLARRMGIR